jgi:hypothetical protein
MLRFVCALTTFGKTIIKLDDDGNYCDRCDWNNVSFAFMLCVDFFASLGHTKFDKEELQTLFVELGDACFGWFFTFALLHMGRGIFDMELCYEFALILLQDFVHAYLVWFRLLEVENKYDDLQLWLRSPHNILSFNW